MRRALAGLGSLVIVGFAGGGAAHASPAQPAASAEVRHLPDCAKDVDVCFMGMGIQALSNGTVSAYFRVKTQHVPKGFEVFARLYTRVRGVWYEEDTKTWKKDKLPHVGHEANLLPDLLTYCNTGPWMMSMHIIGISSTGEHDSEWAFYPGAKRANARQRHTYLVSAKDLPQRQWPWLTISHCP